MKKIAVFGVYLTLFLPIISKSQDLLVTQENDSINCKITNIKNNYIYFVFKHKGEFRDTLLPLEKVKSRKYNYYAESDVPEIVYKDKSMGHVKVRIAVNGGYSYLTAKVHESVPQLLKKYFKQLKSSYHFGFDANYFFHETIGAGIKFSKFNTSNKLENIYIQDNQGNRITGSLSDDISNTFIGASLSTLYSNSDGNFLFLSGSLGAILYHNNKVMPGTEFELTGKTFGVSADLGYDFIISENFAIGVQLSALGGIIREVNIDNGVTQQTIKLNKGEYEGLGRIDLSVGFRFIK